MGPLECKKMLGLLNAIGWAGCETRSQGSSYHRFSAPLLLLMATASRRRSHLSSHRVCRSSHSFMVTESD